MQQLDVSQVKDCACGDLRKATRQLTLFYDKFLEPSGIHITQFTFLVNLARSGAMTISQLTDLLLMDQTTVTRNVRQMVEQGLLESLRGQDQRTRYINLTDKGQETLATAIPFWRQAQDQLEDGMGLPRFKSALTEVSAMVALTK